MGAGGGGGWSEVWSTEISSGEVGTGRGGVELGKEGYVFYSLLFLVGVGCLHTHTRITDKISRALLKQSRD